MPARSTENIAKSLAKLINYSSTDEARMASKSLPAGAKLKLNGELMEVVEPGRTRRKGAPKALRFFGG